ncbi:hypothetical protein CR513_02767, partial [Mucuna pruriens]
MEMYTKPTQYNVWRIITQGDFIVAKSKLEWNQDDFNLLQLNAKTRCIINYALSKSKIKKFCNYKITKKMITRDGIEDVHLRKSFTLQRHYEIFMMKDGETIDEMLEFFRAQNNHKILDSLPKFWEPKSIAIQEDRD